MDISADETLDSPLFPVSPTPKPFVIPDSGCADRGCCNPAACYCQKPRQKGSEMLPAVAALSESEVRDSFTGEAKREGRWSYYFAHNTSEVQWWTGKGT